MKKIYVKKYVDLLLYFSLSFITATGLLMEYRLVPGSKGGRGLSLFGLSRHEWGEWHFYASCVMVAMVCIHLFLNFRFIKAIISNQNTLKLLTMALPALVLILIFMLTPLEKGGGHLHGSVEQSSEVELANY